MQAGGVWLRSKCVPMGQQLGNVPTGRAPSHFGGGFGFVSSPGFVPWVPPSPVSDTQAGSGLWFGS
jgi:hypothetical protein